MKPRDVLAKALGVHRYCHVALLSLQVVSLNARGIGTKFSCDPVRHVVDDERSVVCAAVLGSAIGQSADFEFALRAVDGRVKRALRMPERDLTIVLAMDDKERARDLVSHALERHL